MTTLPTPMELRRQPRVVPFGDAALLAILGDGVDETLNRRVHALATRIRAARPDGSAASTGWGSPVPGYATVLAPFDADRLDPDHAQADLTAWLAEVLAGDPPDDPRMPVVEIQVRYGGDDGPDMAEVAERLGLTPAQVAEAHAAATYRVYLLGFVPGFAYLGPLAQELSLPRRPEPRPRVPAGSVAIAGRQSAVYPFSTPGGWHLIGRTAAQLWDLRQEPPSMLRPGERVRFVPGSRLTNRTMLDVLGPGLQTTVQDGGRPDASALGVPRSGACDPLALAAANILLGNAHDAAALEMTLVGPGLAVLEPVVVALAGADFGARVPEDGRRLRPGTTHLLRAGSTLTFGAARDGARGHLALPGGVDVPVVLGSRSTAPVGGIGGVEGRPLTEGDRIGPMHRDVLGLGGRSWPGPGPQSGVASHVGPRTVHIVEGPHAAEFPSHALELLLATVWTVTPRSDRMGVRLAGPPLPPADGPEPASLGMAWGAVQVPAGGAPIILLADHPTVGGYRVIAVAASADRPVLGQLRAGDEVRFARIDLPRARRLADEAADALRAADSRLRMAEPMA